MHSVLSKRKYRLLIDLLCVGALIVMIVPILRFSMMAIPFADDFSYASNTRDAALEFSGVLKGILYRVYYEYLTFEGGMFKVFCMGVGSIPLLSGGILGLRLYLAFMHILFYSVLFIMIITVIGRITTGNKLAISIEVYTAVVFLLINSHLNEEMYTWALIQSAYVLPIIAMFLTIIFWIKRWETKEKKHYLVFSALAAICGFLASGSPFDITVLNCGICTILCCYAIRQLGRVRNELIILGSVYFGAVINLLSPGNRIRHGNEYGANLLGKTFVIALEHTMYKFGHLVLHTPFVIICIIIFFLFYYSINFNFDGKITYKHPIIFGTFWIIAISMTSWPYTFGNNVVKFEMLEGRVDYVLDIAFYMSVIIWIMYFSGYIKKKHLNQTTLKSWELKIFGGAFALAFISTFLIWGTRENEDFTTKVMYKKLFDSSAHNYSNYQEEILHMIEGGDNDVYIYYDYDKAPKTDRIIRGLRLTDDSEDTGLFWRNNAVARFYGKQHVYMIYPD